MPQFLIEHLDGCTPAMPCASCEAMAFLKNKLSPEDFKEFLQMLEDAAVDPSDTPPNAILSSPWAEELQVSNRIATALREERKHTVGDVVRMTRGEIERMPNIGKTSILALEEELAKHGLRLGMKDV